MSSILLHKFRLIFYFTLVVLLIISFFPADIISVSVNTNLNNTNDEYHYYTYQEMTVFLQNLSINYPEILKVESIGKTYEKRDIWMAKISDNVNVDEDEPGVLLMGAHHGNEKISFEILIYFIKYAIENYEKPNTDDDNDGLINEDIIDGFDNDEDGLIDEDPSEDRIREIINNTQIFLIPMVSPDGVEANTRKNRAPNYGPFGFSKEITSYGVNLNRNYGYKWYLYYLLPFNYHFFINSLDTSFNYKGTHPFSENESRAVRDFVIDHNISISSSYHSFSEIIIYPWGYTSKKTPDEELFYSIADNMSKINKYRIYKGGDYVIPRYGGTLGTSEDWLYGKRAIISYTMELSREYAPKAPTTVFDARWKHVGVNMYVCERSATIDEEIKNFNYI